MFWDDKDHSSMLFGDSRSLKRPDSDGWPKSADSGSTEEFLPPAVAAIRDSLDEDSPKPVPEGEEALSSPVEDHPVAEQIPGDETQPPQELIPAQDSASEDWTMDKTTILTPAAIHHDDEGSEPTQVFPASPWAALAPEAEPQPEVSEPAVPPFEFPGQPLPPEGIEMPDKRPGGWKWAAIAFGVLVVAAVGVLGWWYMTQRPVSVPSLAGKPSVLAVQALNDARLRVGKVSEVETDSAPAGSVVSQSPAAGRETTPNAPVDLVVAAAPNVSVVPDLKGKSEQDAQTALALDRLSAFSVSVFDANTAAGTVLSQMPLSDSKLAPGSSVLLVLSKGAPPTAVRMPSLVGMREADAIALVDTLDKRVAVVQSYDASVAAGTVLAQVPPADTALAADSAIQYLVSLGAGAGNVTVPNVTGGTSANASKALKARGLVAKKFNVSNPTVAKGTVISQLPGASALLVRGSSVAMLVSNGPATTGSMPDLVGRSSAEATAAVKSAGFRPTIIEMKTTDHPAGQVFGQYPEAGTSWGLQLPVVMVVAKQ